MSILENKINFTDYEGTPINDEVINRSDTASFALEHDTFFEDGIEIWTASGKSGIKLTKGTDYELVNLNTQLTQETGKNVYTRLAITNSDYLNQDLYNSYTTLGDFTTFDDLKALEDAIRTDEEVQDIVNSLLQSSGATSISYDDANNTLTISSTDTDTQRTNEDIQDIIESLLSAGNNVSLNYDDVNDVLTISSTDTQRTDGEIQNIISSFSIIANDGYLESDNTQDYTIKVVDGSLALEEV